VAESAEGRRAGISPTAQAGLDRFVGESALPDIVDNANASSPWSIWCRLMRRGTARGAQAVILRGTLAAVVALLRGRCLRWGATDEEVDVFLAGDDLVPVRI
jgi:hypothetical protein